MAKKVFQGVMWFAPKRKKPIAYSTVAESETIGVYAEILTKIGVPTTPNNLLKYFEEQRLIGLYTEKEVLHKYVQLGYGDEEMKFRY